MMKMSKKEQKANSSTDLDQRNQGKHGQHSHVRIRARIFLSASDTFELSSIDGRSGRDNSRCSAA